MPKPLIDSNEVARRLNITRAAVLKRVQRQRLKYVAKAPGDRGAYMFDSDYIDRIAANKPTQ